MKKQGAVRQKLAELEYGSTRRGGRLFKMQKAFKEMEKLLKDAEIKKKKK